MCPSSTRPCTSPWRRTAGSGSTSPSTSGTTTPRSSPTRPLDSRGLPVLFVGVRCPLETIMERRRAAGAERYAIAAEDEPVPPPVLRWQHEVHGDWATTSSSTCLASSASECAAAIAERLRGSPPTRPSPRWHDDGSMPIDHAKLPVSDLDASRAFYSAALVRSAGSSSGTRRRRSASGAATAARTTEPLAFQSATGRSSATHLALTGIPHPLLPDLKRLRPPGHESRGRDHRADRESRRRPRPARPASSTSSAGGDLDLLEEGNGSLPRGARADRQLLPQRPLNSGGRFSRKAATPSAKSSVRVAAVCS